MKILSLLEQVHQVRIPEIVNVQSSGFVLQGLPEKTSALPLSQNNFRLQPLKAISQKTSSTDALTGTVESCDHTGGTGSARRVSRVAHGPAPCPRRFHDRHHARRVYAQSRAVHRASRCVQSGGTALLTSW